MPARAAAESAATSVITAPLSRARGSFNWLASLGIEVVDGDAVEHALSSCWRELDSLERRHWLESGRSPEVAVSLRLSRRREGPRG